MEKGDSTDKKTIQVTRSAMPDFEEYIEEIRPLWDSKWLTNMGEKHKELEDGLKRYLETPFVTLFTNGHLALEAALKVLEMPDGGEVITTPFTFASTTHAIVRSGLAPVFCDIKEDDYTLDPDKIKPLITKKTCAILPVHVYGHICEVEKINAIAKEYGLKVIYDAAHAFGVRRGGRTAASFGDVSMFSFHATKVFHTIEGGAVCYKDGALGEKFDDSKNFGIRNPDEVVYAGGNAKMNEFQAAMGICNLRHVDEEIEKRGKVEAAYRRRLGGVPGIRLSPEIKDDGENRHNHAYFPVVFDGFRHGRDEVMERLSERGVFARKYFYPLTGSFACYSNLGFDPERDTPVAAYVAGRVLTLPMYGDLTAEDVDRICDVIL